MSLLFYVSLHNNCIIIITVPYEFRPTKKKLYIFKLMKKMYVYFNYNFSISKCMMDTYLGVLNARRWLIYNINVTYRKMKMNKFHVRISILA